MELKNTMNEMKNAIETKWNKKIIRQSGTKNLRRTGFMKLSSQENRETRTKKNKKILHKLWVTIKRNKLYIIGLEKK